MRISEKDSAQMAPPLLSAKLSLKIEFSIKTEESPKRYKAPPFDALPSEN